MVTVYIALGSNVGERLEHLHQAVDKLKKELQVSAASHVYETEPMYVEDQPAFLNAAIQAQTDLPPLDLLKLLKRIEKQVGRQEGPRYGPREVDLDLIAYGKLRYRFVVGGQVVLDLPHPRTRERRFVLQPLNDLNPDLVLPSLGKVSELLAETASQASDIRRSADAVISI